MPNYLLDEADIMRVFGNFPYEHADILAYAKLLNTLLERYNWPFRLDIQQDYYYLYRVWCVGLDGKDRQHLSVRTNQPMSKEMLWSWMNGFYSSLEFMEVMRKEPKG